MPEKTHSNKQDSNKGGKKDTPKADNLEKNIKDQEQGNKAETKSADKVDSKITTQENKAEVKNPIDTSKTDGPEKTVPTVSNDALNPNVVKDTVNTDPVKTNTDTNENNPKTTNENVQENSLHLDPLNKGGENEKKYSDESQVQGDNTVKLDTQDQANTTSDKTITESTDNITLIEPEKTKEVIEGKLRKNENDGEGLSGRDHLDNNHDKDIIKDNDLGLDDDEDEFENTDSNLSPENHNAMDPDRDAKTSIPEPTVRVGPDYRGLDVSNLARYYHKPKFLDAGVVVQRIDDPDGTGRLFKVGPNPKDKVELSAYETLDSVQAKNYREKGIIF